ncbi:hypothetical protein D3C80_2007040 [compost metagenome]
MVVTQYEIRPGRLQARKVLSKTLAGEQVVQVGEMDRITDDHIIAAVPLGDVIATASNQPVPCGIADQACQRAGRGRHIRTAVTEA